MPSAPSPSHPLDPERERALAQDCARGDMAAFGQLYDAYAAPIYRYAYYRVFDTALAEDLTSQTFLKAVEAMRSFDPAKGTFGAWIYRIARNVVIDHFRSHKSTEILMDDLEVPSGDDPSGDAARRMQFAQVRSALSQLDPLKRDIVLLRLWDGLSYREIAAVTGKSEGNCKVIFCRTLESLRNTLGPSALLVLFLSYPVHP